MKRIGQLISVATLVASLAGPAAAAPIFEDTFNRSGTGNTVGNGWFEVERTPSDVAIDSSQYLALTDARDGSPDAVATRLDINANGYGNLLLAFSWAVYNNDSDAADYLYLDARTGGSSIWTNLATLSLGGSERVFAEFSTLLEWTDSLLELRFWTDVSGGSGNSNNEGALIDWVRVSGDAPLDPSAVNALDALAIPEPSSVALLGLGMFGLGAFAWQRRPALARR